MFDSPSEILNRQFRQLPLNKTQSEGMPYYHQVINEQRNGFGGYQPQLQQRKIFGFEIFVDNDIIRQMGGESKWFENIIKAGSVESVKFNLDLNIPDLNGRNIQIYDKEMDRKYQSSRSMLSDIYQVFKRIKRQPFSIIIFVPEGMVSLLIGTRGYQINKIMKQSHTTIVVNQPINRMTYRTVKIQGYHSDIARACKIIYEILEDKSSIAYSIQKQPSQLDYTKARVKTKFIFTNSILNYLQYKKKVFLKKVEEETKCMIKFREDNSSRMLKKQQQLCVLLGKLEDVQAVLVMMINLIQIYYDQEKKNYDYTFKMLIPSNYVTKLIGQKGYMIRDIIDRSGGAQIKIMSDKQAERDARQCIISINGTKQNKIDAACLILQQIQCFKNGGPILQSGKSINQNLAQQFKNSIPLRKQQNEQQIIFTQIKEEPKEKVIEQQEQQIKLEQSVNKFIKSIPKQFSDNDNKQEEGLIEGEVEHSIVNNCTPTNEETYQKQSSPVKIQEEKMQQKQQSPPPKSLKQVEKEEKSQSQSIQLRQDKQIVQLKLVVPRRLGTDQKQLKYIETLSHCEVVVKEQRIQGSTQMIIGIRGSMKNNSHCMKLLQKRIIRIAAQSSYGR